MTSVDFNAIAKTLPSAWRSVVVGKVGAANIKVLRMDEQPYAEETHDYNEGLLVLDGELLLQVGQAQVVVKAGQMYLAQAGTAHAVLPGSHGTLVIIDV